VAHLEARAPRDARDRRERRPPGAAVRTSRPRRARSGPLDGWTSRRPGDWTTRRPGTRLSGDLLTAAAGNRLGCDRNGAGPFLARADDFLRRQEPSPTPSPKGDFIVFKRAFSILSIVFVASLAGCAVDVESTGGEDSSEPEEGTENFAASSVRATENSVAAPLSVAGECRCCSVICGPAKDGTEVCWCNGYCDCYQPQ
jgi:hypothetical protein